MQTTLSSYESDVPSPWTLQLWVFPVQVESPDPPALSLPTETHCLCIPVGIYFTLRSRDKVKSNEMDDLCLTLCGASVWVRFVKSGDFSLRLYPIQTLATAVHHIPRMYYAFTVCLVLRENPQETREGGREGSPCWPAREEGQDSAPGELA